MTMPPRLRKLALTAHVTASVGWLGAVVAYLALAVAGLSSPSAPLVRAAYLAMDLLGWMVIVPACLAALVSGLVQSLTTEWGVFRHYWLVAKLALTLVATCVLLLHMPSATRMARLAIDAVLSGGDHRLLRMQLVLHALGGLAILLTATTPSIYKPFGRTPYGQRVRVRPS